MKAYLTSIGEKTTQIAKEQLERYGFEVILLDQSELWFDKYSRFINMANENCIRIDADIIVNKQIMFVNKFQDPSFLMAQFYCWDFYKNEPSICSPVYYKKEAIEIIRKNLDKLDKHRPEATAWRLPDINPFTFTSPMMVGIHGFGQDKIAFNRAKQNKIERGQIQDYDFDLAEKMYDLY